MRQRISHYAISRLLGRMVEQPVWIGECDDAFAEDGSVKVARFVLKE